jgi:drug/metabolite transporter (DMT)-like permease
LRNFDEFISALLAVRFLGEKLNLLGKIGCLLTIFGSIVLVIHAPRDSEVNSLLDFSRKLGTSGNKEKNISLKIFIFFPCYLEFLLFSSFTCFSVFCLIIYYGPRFGSKYVHIYILICSLLGAFTVTACKGLGVGLKEVFNAEYSYSIWLTFVCAIVISICIIIQMIYLNRALDLFPTPIVTTIYYVLFTTCVLITSGILFREWKKLTVIDIMACIMGFLIIICGLILINYHRTSKRKFVFCIK